MYDCSTVDKYWYPFWRGCDRGYWQEDAQILSVWEHSQSYQQDRNDRYHRKDKCLAVCTCVSINPVLYLMINNAYSFKFYFKKRNFVFKFCLKFNVS